MTLGKTKHACCDVFAGRDINAVVPV